MNEDEDEMVKRAVSMSLEEQPRVLEEEEEKLNTQKETGGLPNFTRYIHCI